MFRLKLSHWQWYVCICTTSVVASMNSCVNITCHYLLWKWLQQIINASFRSLSVYKWHCFRPIDRLGHSMNKLVSLYRNVFWRCHEIDNWSFNRNGVQQGMPGSLMCTRSCLTLTVPTYWSWIRWDCDHFDLRWMTGWSQNLRFCRHPWPFQAACLMTKL